DGQLMKDGYKFQIAVEQPESEATVYINSRGMGTANISGQDDLLLAERELRLVFNGDRVKVRQTSVDRKGKAWGYVTEVVQKGVKKIMGKVCIGEGADFFKCASHNEH